MSRCGMGQALSGTQSRPSTSRWASLMLRPAHDIATAAVVARARHEVLAYGVAHVLQRVEALRHFVGIEASALQQAHVERRGVELRRKRDAGGSRPHDADSGSDLGVGIEVARVEDAQLSISRHRPATLQAEGEAAFGSAQVGLSKLVRNVPGLDSLEMSSKTSSSSELRGVWKTRSVFQAAAGRPSAGFPQTRHAPQL